MIICSVFFSIRNNRGKIVVVGGPAIVHTGAVGPLSELINLGFVQGLLAGNALLIHDVEHSLLHTSLGIDIKKGLWFFEGHFLEDLVMPVGLGLDAMWQLVGFYLGWLGKPGKGRALGVNTVKFTGEVLKNIKMGKIKVEIFKKYKLEDAVQAHKDLEARKITGPAIIIP